MAVINPPERKLAKRTSVQCSKSNGLRDGWKGSLKKDMFFFAASWQFFSPRQKIWNIKQPQNTLFLILKKGEVKVKEILD